MGPGAIDLTIEASGAPSCIQIGVHVLKPRYAPTYLLSVSNKYKKYN
jgi:hypothetical protein